MYVCMQNRHSDTVILFWTMDELCGEILNCAEIKIALLVIMHTVAPVNLHLSSKVRRPAPVHTTKTTFAKRQVPH